MQDKIENENVPRSVAWTAIPLYNAFTQLTPVIPKMYWDVYSQEERIKAICEHIDKIIAYANTLGIQINKNTDQIEKILDEFDEFKAGAYDDYYEKVISKWVEVNMPSIMKQAARMVFFGLTADGYFAAYIPETWADISFDTGFDYDNKSEYGHLILKY